MHRATGRCSSPETLHNCKLPNVCNFLPFSNFANLLTNPSSKMGSQGPLTEVLTHLKICFIKKGFEEQHRIDGVRDLWGTKGKKKKSSSLSYMECLREGALCTFTLESLIKNHFHGKQWDIFHINMHRTVVSISVGMLFPFAMTMNPYCYGMKRILQHLGFIKTL